MGPLCTGSVGSNVKDPGVQMERIRGFKYKGSGGSNIKDPGVQMYPGSFTFELVVLIEIFFRENFRFRTKFKISIPAKFMLEISWIFEIISTKRGLEIS